MRQIFVLFFIYISLTVENSYTQIDTLTISKCVEIALENNPQIKIAEAAYEGNEAILSLNRSGLFPQVNFQSAVNRNGGTFFSGPISRTGNYENYSVGFQGTQLVFDFWKTYSKISSSSDFSEASYQDMKSVQQNIILNVYITYLNYLQSKRIYELNIEIQKQAQEHLRQAKTSYEIGKKPQFDVIKAEADLENTNLNVIRASNSIKNSFVQLENATGKKLPDKPVLQDHLEELDQSFPAFEKILEIAYSTRPEVLSSLARVEANKSLVSSAWSANLPSINATGGYTWRSYSLDQQFLPSWNIGLSLSMPVFQWGLFSAGIEQAKANLKSSEFSKNAVMQAVLLDVQQQYLNIEESQSRIEVSKKLVKQAEEALKLAEGRYNSDVGSAIEITDARITFLNAKVSFIQSLYDFQIASAKLKRVMGIIK